MFVDPVAVLTTFAVIFPAELPDKSMFAAIVLGTRMRALPVWFGLAGAFLVHVIIAVSAGGILSLLPDKPVALVVTLFFLVGAAVLTFKTPEKHDATEFDAKGRSDGKSNLRIAATAFGILFVSEWGDLTQITTVNLSARYNDPISVGIGATAALWLISGLGVLLGSRIERRIPLTVLRRIAGLVMLSLAAWSFADFLRLP